MNSVNSLLLREFSVLTLEEKIEVKTLGRPTPNIPLVQNNQLISRKYVRRFNPDCYTKYEWMCGCDTRNALFCFPCLLFGGKAREDAWTKTGVIDLKHLTEKAKKHELSRTHMNCCMELAVLSKVNIMSQLDSAYCQSIAKQNEQISKNRHILNRIINCVKFCGAFGLALRGHDDIEESLNRRIFHSLIDFAAEIDVSLREHLATATVFKGTSETIQNEILDCVLEVCREIINQEIEEAQFLAVMADETTDVSNHCHMGIVFRYERNGKAVERFWGFFNPESTDAEGLSDCILKEIEPHLHKNAAKLIAQSYLGAGIMSGRIAGVQAKVKMIYPQAHFVHCYTHQLHLIMERALSQNSQVRIFLSNLSSIPAFFSNSSNHNSVLRRIVDEKLPYCFTAHWTYNLRTVNAVFKHRKELIECFGEIEISVKNSSTINEAGGLKRLLQDTTFVFWLTVFHEIMPHVDKLYHHLQRRQTGFTQVNNAISVFQKTVTAKRKELDEEMYQQVEATHGLVTGLSVFEGTVTVKCEGIDENMYQQVESTPGLVTGSKRNNAISVFKEAVTVKCEEIDEEIDQQVESKPELVRKSKRKRVNEDQADIRTVAAEEICDEITSQAEDRFEFTDVQCEEIDEVIDQKVETTPGLVTGYKGKRNNEGQEDRRTVAAEEICDKITSQVRFELTDVQCEEIDEETDQQVGATYGLVVGSKRKWDNRDQDDRRTVAAQEICDVMTSQVSDRPSFELTDVQCEEIDEGTEQQVGATPGLVSGSKRKMDNQEQENRRTAAAQEICDVITSQVRDRFEFTDHLLSANLLDSSMFKAYCKRFPENELSSTVEAYPMLDKKRLRNELTVLYKRLDFREVRGVLPILQFIIGNNLTSVFSEIHKLLRIIVTTPMRTAEAERCFSSFKRIKTFLRNSMDQERLTALGMISLENELISKTVDFNERVMEKFIHLKNRRMDFIYKH